LIGSPRPRREYRPHQKGGLDLAGVQLARRETGVGDTLNGLIAWARENV